MEKGTEEWWLMGNYKFGGGELGEVGEMNERGSGGHSVAQCVALLNEPKGRLQLLHHGTMNDTDNTLPTIIKDCDSNWDNGLL